MVKLGFWQLDRAAEKQALFQDYQRYAENAQADAAADLSLMKREPDRFEPVAVSGKFDTDRYFLIDNQLHDGQPGYHIIGLLEPTNRDSLIAVNLGWIKAPALRAELPDIDLPNQAVSFVALAHYPQENVFINDVQEQSIGIWPQRVPQFMPKDIATTYNLEVAPFVLLVAEHEPFGYTREWRPNVMPAEKHHAYALQWFTLAIAALVIFIIAVIRINKQKQEE